MRAIRIFTLLLPVLAAGCGQDMAGGKGAVTPAGLKDNLSAPTPFLQVVISYHENGRKMSETAYQSGRQTGRWLYWYANGRKAAEIEFQDGVEISRIEWDSYGHLKPFPTPGLIWQGVP